MPTTFNWFYLGTSATSLDPTEGNTVAENINAFVGNTYGSTGSPLFTKIASATMIDVGGSATALDGDNTVANDQFSTNIGSGTQTFTFDISVQYNATITYTNGTTATVTAVVVQSTTGELFLAPEATSNADTVAFEARPIRSITFNSVASYSGNLGTDRVVTGFSDGIVEGTAGNDLINGAYIEPAAFGRDRIDNNDAVLPGTSGNDDYIRAGAGNDTILAGSGNDTIDGGTGADSINGGSGSDTVTYVNSNAAVTVSLATGTGTGGDAQGDTLTNVENLTGSAFNDVLTGDAGANVLDGGAGNDVLQGGAGADTLIGGSGTDTASYANSISGVTVNLTTGTGTGGDAQGDTLSGIENLTGSAFNDVLTGDAGANVLDGGAGNDILQGGAGADTLIGGSGTDTASYANSTAGVTVNLTTGTGTGGDAQGDTLSGIENLTGSAFNDVLTGDAGANVLDGGAGNDVLQGGAGADTLIGGSGTDTASYANSISGVTVNLTTGTGTGGDAQGDTLSGIENLTGSAFNDVLTGDAGANVLDGGAGNDILQGGAGADTLIGGSGTDTASYANSTAGVTVNLTTGTGTGGDAQGDTLSGIENLTGSAFNDVLTGDAGANVLDGGAGNDVLQGGAGADTLIGGSGTDTASYANSISGVTVNLTTGTGTGGDAQGDTLSGIENLTGSAFNDVLTGDAGANVLDGGAGNDILQGGAGADTLIGGSGTDTASYANSISGVTVNLTTGTGTGGDAQGDTLSGIENLTGSAFNDVLTGDAGANVLDGGAGNDILQGGAGADTLIGGAGNDVFIYSIGSGADVIVDFNTGNTGSITDGIQSNNDFVDLSGFYNASSLAAYNAGNGAFPDLSHALWLMRADIADGKLDGIINGITLGLGIDLTLTGATGTDLTFDNTNVVCFVKGTRILTEFGEVAIEDLSRGNNVTTYDHGNQPIRWIGSKKVEATGKHAPICIKAGTYGNTRDLLVSPQHRMMISGWNVELYFGELEVLAAAKHLVDGDRVCVLATSEVEYFHMIFDRHEIVFAEGAASESFHPGDLGMSALDQASREEILGLFPDLRTVGPASYGSVARRSLRAAETAVLVAAARPRREAKMHCRPDASSPRYRKFNDPSDRQKNVPLLDGISATVPEDARGNSNDGWAQII